MSEVRPGVGSSISVAQFKTNRNLRVVDFASDIGPFNVYFEEPEPAAREASVWSDMNRAFSEPVMPNESVADYAPTQILSELFKSEGYDGLMYKSSLGSGHNVVLFDCDAADLVNCALYEARTVTFEFEQTDNPYFVHPRL